MHALRGFIGMLCMYAVAIVSAGTAPIDAGSADTPTESASIKDLQLQVGRESLRCCYRIENSSTRDIWLCDAMEDGFADCETVWGDDRQSFVIRRRTEIAWDIARNTPLARYIRLQAGGTLTETLLLPLPLCPRGLFSNEGAPPDAEYVTRVSLEIGYYEGDLPRMIEDSLAEEAKRKENEVPLVLFFNEFNEYHRKSAEEVLFFVEPAGPPVKGERVLRTLVEGQHIPRRVGDERRPRIPDLQASTRLEIIYEPSLLQYCFPHPDQQGLFNSTETRYLQSLSTVVLTDLDCITEFASEIRKSSSRAISIVRPSAQVVSYRNDDRLAMLRVYDDSVVNESDEPFICPAPYEDGYFEAFKGLASGVRPFMQRVGCARNLINLYNRFRLYPKAERWRLTELDKDGEARGRSTPELAYPSARGWCDSLVAAYMSAGMLDEWANKPFMCESAGGGRCHYAMNPDCMPSSPKDVVLLFETKAGWNQHGGVELFTFDNHTPRGGLVLLNDGTVKFIRTEEELKQLRWK